MEGRIEEKEKKENLAEARTQIQRQLGNIWIPWEFPEVLAE